MFGLRELHKYSDAFKERDSRGWLPMHRASVQPDASVLDVVLLGEQTQHACVEVQTNE